MFPKNIFTLQLNIGKHAVSVAGLYTWNQLPVTTKYSETVDIFYKLQNMFEIAFPPKMLVFQ